jgi:hypothetical protein
MIIVYGITCDELAENKTARQSYAKKMLEVKSLYYRLCDKINILYFYIICL